MSKMSAPRMDVIRFNESDVIVASNGGRKTLSISGIGDGQGNNASFVFGGNGGSWSSEQIVFDNSSFAAGINSYLGIENSSGIRVKVLGENGGSYPLINLVYDEYAARDNNYNANYNGNYTWDGSDFIHQ